LEGKTVTIEDCERLADLTRSDLARTRPAFRRRARRDHGVRKRLVWHNFEVRRLPLGYQDFDEHTGVIRHKNSEARLPS
jgi:hypothetical protein